MKFIYFLPLSLLLMNCSGTENESITPDEVLMDSSFIEVDHTSELNEELESDATPSFMLFDDYYTQITSKTLLNEFFPKDAIKEDTTWYAEGTVMMLSSRLTNPDNGQVLNFVWSQKDNETLYRLEAYHFIYDENYEVSAKQKIESEYGLYAGMTLSDLVKWNDDQPIEFSGFGWDYGGGIFVAEGSKLAEVPLGVRLDIDYSEDINYNEVMGDMTLMSNDDVVDPSTIMVSELSYTNDEEEPEF